MYADVSDSGSVYKPDVRMVTTLSRETQSALTLSRETQSALQAGCCI